MSDPGVRQRLRRWCRGFCRTSNEGYGAALNRGIMAAHTPFVALTNPVVAIQPGGYRELVRFMEERPRAAGASGIVVHVRDYPSRFERDRLFPRGKVAVHFGD